MGFPFLLSIFNLFYRILHDFCGTGHAMVLHRFCAAASVFALCNGIGARRWHGAWHVFQQAKQLFAFSIWFAESAYLIRLMSFFDHELLPVLAIFRLSQQCLLYL